MRFEESKPVPSQRDESGSVVALLPAIVLLGVIALGAIGLDLAHNITTRTAEQNATDSAALAGVAYIVQNNAGADTGLGTSPPVGAYQTALLNPGTGTSSQLTATNVAGTNYADGKPVSSAGGATLATVPSPPAGPIAAQSGTFPSNNGTFQINSQMPIKNMFAGIIGHPTDIVPVQSIATGYSTVVGVDPNQLFPIAVSLDSTTGHSTTASDNNLPLYMCAIGTQTAFTLQEPCANAAWTTFNALPAGSAYPSVSTEVNWINTALSPYTGSTFVPGTYVPAQLVGEKNSQGTQPVPGVANPTYPYATGGIDLWADVSNPTNFAASLPLTVNLPVIGGDQPFRQTTTAAGAVVAPDPSHNTQTLSTGTTPFGPQTHPLLGFIGFQITSAVYGPDPTTGQQELQYIKGTIVKTLVKGTPGVANPTVLPAAAVLPKNTIGAANITQLNNAMDLALQDLSPGIVMLGVTNLNVGPANQPAGATGTGPSAAIPIVNTDSYYWTGTQTGITAYEGEGAGVPLNGTNVAQYLGSSYTTTFGGYTINYTQGQNAAAFPTNPPTGQPRLEPNLGGITGTGIVYSTAQALPNTPITITMYFTDETGLYKIAGISAWTKDGLTELGTAASQGITYSVIPASPSLGYTGSGPGHGTIPGTWTLPTGFGIDTYISQVTINVPALSTPEVLQIDSIDADRSGDTGITLIDIQFPNCPTPIG
jgi:hypothetical protein